MKLNGKLFTRSFSFQHVSELTVLQFLGDINTDSAPGVSDISIKIVKKAIPYLISILTHILNSMIITYSIPSEFKCAIVTQLYKGKGSKREINNYRGISVLPPLAKLFEKVLASQICDYF